MNKLTDEEKKNLIADLVAGIIAAIIIVVFFAIWTPARDYGLAEQQRVKLCPDEFGRRTVCQPLTVGRGQ